MPSSGDFYVDEINHEERFSVYVKTSWDIFSETIQEIKNVALDKSEANPEYSGKVATGVDITVKAAGTIAGINILCIFRNYGIPELILRRLLKKSSLNFHYGNTGCGVFKQGI